MIWTSSHCSSFVYFWGFDIRVMLSVYCEKNSKRLDYVLEFIFSDILGMPFKKVSYNEFINIPGPALHYASERINDSCRIPSSGLLFETGIKYFKPRIDIWNDIPVLFPDNPGEEIPFDLFSAVFYLISRYEEYMPFKSDKFGRFSAKSSLAYKHNFLHLPIVDKWVFQLSEILRNKYKGIEFTQRSFSSIHTIDIDQAWAFKHKGILRSAAATLRDIFTGDFRELHNRAKVLTGKNEDPYFTYPYLRNMESLYGISNIYFFLAGDYGKYDINISTGKKAFRNLIKEISGKAYTGIHPSVRSNYDPGRILKEKKRLEQITGYQITKSRQHYLVVKFPGTFENLIKYGINEDYSLGYHDGYGFRAGTCTPFKFYNIVREKITDLKLIPFQIMDVTMNNYLNLTPDNAIFECKRLIEETKKVQGTFVSLWHNETLHDQGIWKGWRKVYEHMLKNIYD